MYFSIDSELSRIVCGLFEKLPSSETTEEHESNLSSVENAGIEQLPSAENVPSLTILPTNSEVSNLWTISINLHIKLTSNI
jgi:hypothetical protein